MLDGEILFYGPYPNSNRSPNPESGLGLLLHSIEKSETILSSSLQADDADIWVTGFKTWLDSVHATKWPEEENNETGGGTSKVIKLSIPPKVQKRKKKTASRRDKRTKVSGIIQSFFFPLFLRSYS